MLSFTRGDSIEITSGLGSLLIAGSLCAATSAEDHDKIAAYQLSQINSLKKEIVELKKQADIAERVHAQGICFSALPGVTNKSVIAIPLENNNVDLDQVCHEKINAGWHAVVLLKEGTSIRTVLL